jgi:hypothetical protein
MRIWVSGIMASSKEKRCHEYSGVTWKCPCYLQATKVLLCNILLIREINAKE